MRWQGVKWLVPSGIPMWLQLWLRIECWWLYMHGYKWMHVSLLCLYVALSLVKIVIIIINITIIIIFRFKWLPGSIQSLSKRSSLSALCNRGRQGHISRRRPGCWWSERIGQLAREVTFCTVGYRQSSKASIDYCVHAKGHLYLMYMQCQCHRMNLSSWKCNSLLLAFVQMTCQMHSTASVYQCHVETVTVKHYLSSDTLGMLFLSYERSTCVTAYEF